jgi:hypothetical protein
MRGNVNHRVWLDVQVTALQKKRIRIRVQFGFRYPGLTTDVDLPAPVVIAKGIIDYFIDLHQLALDFDLKRRGRNGKWRRLLEQVSQLEDGVRRSFVRGADRVASFASIKEQEQQYKYDKKQFSVVSHMVP